MAQKPSIPKGTRDFSQSEMARRNYIFDNIRTIFRLHGFQQIETPAMENLSTLMGKYGDEGDKLLFRILNSGDAFSGIDYESFREEGDSYNSKALALKVAEKGLRYDLTVPFTRESWHGRIRASRGVGASLSEEELVRWDTEHRALLEKIAPEEFGILHYAALAVLRKK